MAVAILTIPMPDGTLPWSEFRSSISGVIYTIRIRYNVRSQRYVMQIEDSSGNVILAGIPILIERSLIGQYPTLAIPPGVLFATDDSGQEQQPTQNSFGVDHTLWYLDPTA